MRIERLCACVSLHLLSLYRAPRHCERLALFVAGHQLGAMSLMQHRDRHSNPREVKVTHPRHLTRLPLLTLSPFPFPPNKQMLTSRWRPALLCRGSRCFSAVHMKPPGIDELLKVFMDIPLERTRNFAIVAHIDHGKSISAPTPCSCVRSCFRWLFYIKWERAGPP